MAKRKTTVGKPHKSILKLTSIIVVAIFILILLIGIVIEYVPERESDRPTNSQIDAAKTIVLADLNATGEDSARFQLSVSDRLRHRGNDLVLEVCLNDNATKRLYLVDLNASTILVQAKTDYYTNDFKFRREFDSCRNR